MSTTYSDLLHDSLAGERAIEQVLEIKTAGERAAALTQRLLAFSRRQIMQPKALDLNATVADFAWSKAAASFVANPNRLVSRTELFLDFIPDGFVKHAGEEVA